MRKEIVTVLAIIALIILIYSIAKPSHLHQDIEMEYCGGCHTEESIQRVHEVDPMGTGCVNAECHPEAITAFSVHEEILPSECDRCHEFGGEPMYSDCDLCHGSYHQLEGRIDIEGKPCKDCHKSHSILTDGGCARCHSEEYDDLKTEGGRHSEISGSCYACHIEHKSIPDCLDCHDESEHGEIIITTECEQCHDGHIPGKVKFTSVNTSEQCNNCHPAVVQEFQDKPSKHSDIQCVECHQQHREKINCVTCHEDTHAGLSDLTIKKCLACHGVAHSPDKYGY
jgi:hypothetical protein